MRNVMVWTLTWLLLAVGGGSAWALEQCKPAMPIVFDRWFVPFTDANVQFETTGGPVFVSNAPESIWPDGAQRPDGSAIFGQVNATLYRDDMTGAFRLWASHHNRTDGDLAFWVYVSNHGDEAVRFSRRLEAFGKGSITSAAGDATVEFMQGQPEQHVLATLQPGESFYYAYSHEVGSNEASVYIAEFRAETMQGAPASVEVSHVVTWADVTDPTPFATTPTIARTNATAERSDDYRGVLAHWGRRGRITALLHDVIRVQGIKLGDLGYSGEQEPLISSWNTAGEPQAPQEVRFVTPTIDRMRLAYWLTEYEIHVDFDNRSSYPVIHTLYGSNGSNPGFATYTLDEGDVRRCHFAINHVVPVTREPAYTMRTMIMPSMTLPFALYFVVGNDEEILRR